MDRNIVYTKLMVAIGLVAVLAACTIANDPTPQEPLTEVVTVERPSATATLTPLAETSTPTVSPAPLPTSAPLAAWTRPPATPRPTTTPFPNMVWSNDFDKVGTLNANIFLWSPTKNQALVGRCPTYRFPDIDPSEIYVGSFSAPDLTISPIFPKADACRATSAFSISPDGKFAVMYTLEGYDSGIPNGTFWVANLVNPDARAFAFPFPEDIFGIKGWIDNSSFFYTGYAGGGHIYTSVINAVTGEKGQSGLVHGDFLDAHFGYVAAFDGMDYDSRVTAAVLTNSENEYGYLLESGPHVNVLSRKVSETSFEHLFNSRYEDWLPGVPQMLVSTWKGDTSLWDFDLLHEPGIVDLQLWDVETNELTLIVPQAIYGRFSPDGRFLLYLTPASDYPIAHLYEWQNEQMIVEQPVIASRESGSPIEFEMNFSPDGRFLTYFTPNDDGTTSLQIIDTMNGEPLKQFANPVARVTWSPTSEQFIYRDSDGNLALFTVGEGHTQPLTLEGGQLLTNPQWSYDGRYLSVSVQNEFGGETAVLNLIASSAEN